MVADSKQHPAAANVPGRGALSWQPVARAGWGVPGSPSTEGAAPRVPAARGGRALAFVVCLLTPFAVCSGARLLLPAVSTGGVHTGTQPDA